MLDPAKRGWALMFAVFLLLIAAAPARSHTDLTSTSPSDGQTLKTAPQEVSMTFVESLLKGGQRLVVSSPTGEKIDLDAKVSGATVSAAWPQTEQSGKYKVSYRVVATDGHPLEGAITFTIKGAPAPATAPPDAAASPVASPVPQEENSGGGGVNPLVPALVVAAGLVAVFLVWRSRAD